MRDSITVHLAPGWQELSAADFAPAFADVAGDAVRYIAAIPPERQSRRGQGPRGPRPGS